MRILLVQTWYPEFLTELYRAEPQLARLPFEPQLQRLFDTAFGIGNAYSHGLRKAGCDACEVICNADEVQARWATEHGLALEGNIHDRRRQIIAAQVEHFRPDVLYVFEWSPLGDAFLNDMRGRVRLLTGQIASPLPANRTFAAYDLMLSSWPPVVNYFRTHGTPAVPFRLGFDERVLSGLASRRSTGGAEKKYDITFVGGFAPSHRNRIPFLDALLRIRPVDIFAYGIETVSPSSPIHAHYRGQAWGWRMYEVLEASRITINLHAEIDVRGDVSHRFANNMRLYEATGVGTCLLTESRDNLGDLFEIGREIVAYDDPEEAARKISHLLANDTARRGIAKAGQQRTLREHTYSSRTQELARILDEALRNSQRSVGTVSTVPL
ncbi:MAG: glycosyltransferase [Phycisphaerae bacterium]|nr:glycosyltransferase [Phycisphaerae bacterium]